MALVRLGQTGQAGQFLDELSDADREHGEIRIGEAALRLAEGDPRAAIAALAPALDGGAGGYWGFELAEAYVLEATARDSLGDPGAADHALERALDLAEPRRPVLLSCCIPRRACSNATPSTAPPTPPWSPRSAACSPPGGPGDGQSPHEQGGSGGTVLTRRPEPLLEPLSDSEVRVLRYLPTNLTTPEIARELTVSPNTIRTHVRHMYAKFGTHHRAETVELARALGLLAPARTSPASR